MTTPQLVGPPSPRSEKPGDTAGSMDIDQLAFASAPTASSTTTCTSELPRIRAVQLMTGLELGLQPVGRTDQW